MANRAYNNIVFDTTGFNGGAENFTKQFFNLLPDEYALELKELSAKSMFSDEVLTRYMKRSSQARYSLSNLIEMVNQQLGLGITLNDVDNALFAFQRYSRGYYDADDCDENEVMITGIQSKADIAFPLFYLFAFLGIKTLVPISLDEYGDWYRRGYQVYLNGNNQLVEIEDEYQVNLTTDVVSKLIEDFI